jgi:hypothetical protein
VSELQTKVSAYAEELITVPRAHVRMELRQDEHGLTLVHEGHMMVECPLTRQGMMAAGFLAEALGVKMPPLGQSVAARVSTGVLFRALGVCSLDFDKEESFMLLERLLEEAEIQRGGSRDDA